jgi:hypothetical protein
VKPLPRPVRWIAFSALIASAFAVPVHATATATTFHYKEFAQGAQVIYSDCPFGDWLPSIDTACTYYTVYWVKFSRTTEGGSIGRRSADWHAEYSKETDLVHPDGSGYPLAIEAGFAPTAGTYDKTHLGSAHMDAVTIPVQIIDPETGVASPSGRSVSLSAFNWTAQSPTYQYGNDGPAFGPAPHHQSGPCETTNSLAHQKVRVGSVTGSVDGKSLSDFYLLPQIPGQDPPDAGGVIFNNWFHINDVTHCVADRAIG